jgi:hypothetical protein
MGNDTASQLQYFARAMKAPRIGEAAMRLADQARRAGWPHEECVWRCLPSYEAIHSRRNAAR